eukprot:12211406-Alexandrium_andersonii.AAC.1
MAASSTSMPSPTPQVGGSSVGICCCSGGGGSSGSAGAPHPGGAAHTPGRRGPGRGCARGP